MSDWRGRERGRGRSSGGGSFRGGRRSFDQRDTGPPDRVEEVGHFLHPCEGDLVCKASHQKIPFFNAPIFLENKSQIGKVDEIFGPMTDYFFSVKLGPNMNASSFPEKQKLFIDPNRLLPLERFLPKPKTATIPGMKPQRGEFRGGRGSRGGGYRGGGGRGGPRGRGFGSSRGFRRSSSFRGRS